MPSWRRAFPGSFPEESEVEATITPIVERSVPPLLLVGTIWHGCTDGYQDRQEASDLKRIGVSSTCM